MAAATMFAPAAANGAKRQKRVPLACPPPHAHVVLADGEAVLFWFINYNTELEREAACSNSNKKPFVLIETKEFDYEGPLFGQPALAGNMLAYDRSTHYGSWRYQSARPASWVVQVHDLRTHHLIHSAPASTSPPPPLKVTGGGPTEGIVVKSDGSVAWIGAIEGWKTDERFEPAATGAINYEVWELDRTGQHLLAEGPHIVPNSIALAGSTVYWTDGGVASSANLN